MANVILNPGAVGGKAAVVQPFDASKTALFLNVLQAGPISASFSTAAGVATPLSGAMDALRLKAPVANGYSLAGASFSVGADRFVSKVNGEIQRNPSPTSGIGSTVGALTPATGELVIAAWEAGAGSAVSNWRAMAGAPINGAFTPYNTYACTFRLATAPIRTGTFSVLGTMQDGTTFNYTADSNGYINQPLVKGVINYQTGVVQLVGVSPSAPAGVAEKVDLSFLGIPGVTSEYIALIRQETLRYNAVAFTYLPLNADLLGIDPVRLPSDGRVPIYRPGELAVLGHTGTTAPATAVVGGVVNCGRTRLSRVRVLGNDGHVIDTGYTVDREAGTVTWTNVTGYSQPVRVEHRIEFMALVRDVQIDGSVTFTREVDHAFPMGSYLSSCLRLGDLKARVPLVFDQATWDNVTFSDVPGTAAPGTYNTTGYPIEVSNAGAITERWALKFKTTLTFDIIGEHVGNIGEGSINTLTQPINAITGEPYFTIPIGGWGSGWVGGNILRINTIGAMYPIWMVRTVQQGPEAAEDYSFLTIVRGDVDNPIA